MESKVVSISRSLAAGGEEIGQLVAKELGFRYVDDEIVIKASAYAGVSPETVDQVEHSQSLIDRILEGMAASAEFAPTVGTASLIGTPAFTQSQSRDLYQSLIQRVIREVAEAGQVVLLAHGTSIALANMSGLLRVLVTASPEVRAERLTGIADVDERQAKKAIQDSDRERQNYFRRLYNLRQELPTHYDLVVNTDRLTVPEAAKLIVVAARG